MKKMKFFSMTVFIAILSLVAVGCGTSSSSNGTTGDSDKVTLKVATYFAVTSQQWTMVTEPWMKKVEELTNGKVEFDTYPGEQLGKAGDMIQLIGDGVADIGVYPANYFPDNMPLSNMLAGLPNLSQSANQGTLAYNELVQQNSDLLETDYLKNGVRPIVNHVSPTYELWTTGKEIRVPADLKGMKIRTPGGVANELYEFMGTVPVAVSHTETYEALEKGVIDALSYSSVAMAAAGTNEILEYGIFPRIGTAIHGLVINEKVWKGLPEDVQKALLEAGQEIAKTSGVAYDEDTLKIEEEFTKDGKVIAELTQEEQDQWNKVAEDFTKTWLKENTSDDLPYVEVLNSYKDLLEKHK